MNAPKLVCNVLEGCMCTLATEMSALALPLVPIAE